MNIIRRVQFMILVAAVSAVPALAERRAMLGENAALRYWSAFAQMQDSALSDEQAKELSGILTGASPYVDRKYAELVDRNKLALETMARGAALEVCDWGVEYELGPEAPVEYVRKALALGRLNVLYAYHLLKRGDQEGSVRFLTAGLNFSQDVGTGGSLFAAVAAKSLLVAHLTAVDFASRTSGLSAAQRESLAAAIKHIGPNGLDWQSAARRELTTLPASNSEAMAALSRITPSYVGVMSRPSGLGELQKLIAVAPQSVKDMLPNPKRVLEEKEMLNAKILETRALLK